MVSFVAANFGRKARQRILHSVNDWFRIVTRLLRGCVTLAGAYRRSLWRRIELVLDVSDGSQHRAVTALRGLLKLLNGLFELAHLLSHRIAVRRDDWRGRRWRLRGHRYDRYLEVLPTTVRCVSAQSQPDETGEWELFDWLPSSAGLSQRECQGDGYSHARTNRQ